jgi:drug/metabolite transporter (DMT)-like permease
VNPNYHAWRVAETEHPPRIIGDVAAPEETSSTSRTAISSRFAWAVLGTLYVVWGTTYLGIAKVNASIPPLVGAGIRFLVAGTVLFAFRRVATGERPARRHWWSAAVIGAFLLLGGNGLVAVAETSVPTGIVALIIALVPIWLALIDRVILRSTNPSWRTVAGLVAGFSGAALLVGGSAVGHVSLVGLLAAVTASVSWASGSMYARRAFLPSDALMASGMQQMMGGLVILAVAVVIGEAGRFHPYQVTRSSWLGLVYLISIGSFVGFSCYLWLLRNVRTSLVSTYAYVNPLVAVSLGVFVLGESLSLRELAAGGVILGSVALIVSTGGVHRTDDDAERSHPGEKRRSELEAELPFEGGSGTQQGPLAEDGRGELEPDGKSG